MKNKQMHVFPPELRTAHRVPRWAIVHTLNRDTIAGHSWFVAIYAVLIADLIKWDGDWLSLVWSAIEHDLDETITGDIVSPVKREIADRERMSQYIERKMASRLGAIVAMSRYMYKDLSPGEEEAIDAIVGAADRLDALLYLILEERMGNQVVSPLIADVMLRLESSWRALPAPKDVLNRTWQTDVLPAIEAHKTEGGKGIF